MHPFITCRRKNRALIKSSESIIEELANRLDKNPLVRIWVRVNQSLTLFALLVAAVGFAVALKKFNVDELKADEDRVAKAWDVVSRMAGKQGNGGQVSALERLNAFGISLDFVDIHNTFAAGVKLRNAKLHGANLSGANLEGADLSDADLEEANLIGTNLAGAKLSGTNMFDAKFKNARLAFAKVDLGIVLASDMRDADLTGAEIVFEDSEGEKWEAFSDSLAEVLDIGEMQALFDSACANPQFSPAMNPLLEVKPPRHRCKVEPDYISYLRKYSKKDWNVPIEKVLAVHLAKPRTNTDASR